MEKSKFDIHKVFNILHLFMVVILIASFFVLTKAGVSLIPILLSFLMTFIGVLLFFFNFYVSKRKDQPYNIAALGLCAVLFGMCNLAGTVFFSAQTAQSVVFTFQNLFILVAVYPSLCFIVSLTEKKKKVYEQYGFVVWLGYLIFIFAVRYLTHRSFFELRFLFYLAYIIYAFIARSIVHEDRIYCRENNIRKDHNYKYFAVGSAFFIVCSVLEAIIRVTGIGAQEHRGNLFRLGVCIALFSFMLQFLEWWFGKNEAVRRDLLINKVLYQAMASDKTENNINGMLSLVGKELGVGRVYIYENMYNGTFSNTYEWRSERFGSKTDHFKVVPYKGYVDFLINDYEVYGKALMRDAAKLDSVADAGLIENLQKDGIFNMVAYPLVSDGKYVGFCGADNIPDKDLEFVTDTLHILSYFFLQLLNQRDRVNRLVQYGYYDTLTGVGNRRAFDRFFEINCEKNRSYGFIMCDINGLKQVNDTKGHEAGDELIKDVADALSAVFGNDNVYRLGGDEFAAISYVETPDSFDVRIHEIRAQLAKRGRSASIGYVFCRNNEMKFDAVIKEADRLMYIEKEKYHMENPR